MELYRSVCCPRCSDDEDEHDADRVLWGESSNVHSFLQCYLLRRSFSFCQDFLFLLLKNSNFHRMRRVYRLSLYSIRFLYHHKTHKILLINNKTHTYTFFPESSPKEKESFAVKRDTIQIQSHHHFFGEKQYEEEEVKHLYIYTSIQSIDYR